MEERQEELRREVGRIISAASRLLDVVEGIFADEKQFYRYQIQDTKDGKKTIREKQMKKADIGELKQTASILKDAVSTLKTAEEMLSGRDALDSTILVTFDAGEEAFNE